MRFKLLGLVVVLALSLSPLYGAPDQQLPPDDGGTLGGCSKECYTTCTGPAGVECCCYYHCPSGTTYGCTQGAYCSNTDTSCL